MQGCVLFWFCSVSRNLYRLHHTRGIFTYLRKYRARLWQLIFVVGRYALWVDIWNYVEDAGHAGRQFSKGTRLGSKPHPLLSRWTSSVKEAELHTQTWGNVLPEITMNVSVRKGRQIAGQDQTQWTVNGISVKGRSRRKGRQGLALDGSLQDFSLRRGTGMRSREQGEEQRWVHKANTGFTSFGWGLALWSMEAVMHHVLFFLKTEIKFA